MPDEGRLADYDQVEERKVGFMANDARLEKIRNAADSGKMDSSTEQTVAQMNAAKEYKRIMATLNSKKQ